MKKTFLLLIVVALLSSVGTVSTASATKIKVVKLDVRGVPNAVMAAYTRIVDDIINSNFPGRDWEDSDITWTKDKNIWTASGTVRLINGGGGPYVMIHSARFTSNGNVIEFLYTVIIPV